MQLKILKEEGHEIALMGLGLSHKRASLSLEEWWTEEKYQRMEKVAQKLAHRGGGHNKFLESIVVWMWIKAPRYFWSEFDTYRVGMTKQSESTMHTLMKEKLTRGHFNKIPSAHLDTLNEWRTMGCGIETMKSFLTEGYLQGRIVCTNYKTLQNIYAQRRTHKLPEWQEFCQWLEGALEHGEYL